MAKFKYTAIDQAGKQKSGRVEAASEEEANAKVTGMGLMVTSIQSEGGQKAAPAAEGAAPRKKPSAFHFGAIISKEDLTVFTRQMSTLLQAGLPLLRSLEVMIRQEKNERFREVLITIADNVRTGNNLSEGMLQYPKVFDRLYINMVKAGEAGGVLDVVFSRLAKFMEKSVKTQKKIKSAMVYPVMVMTVAVIIVSVLMVFVIPKFQAIFAAQGGAKMPALTQMVINASNFMKNNIFTTIGICVALYFGVKFLLRTKKGKAVFDWAVLRMPKIGDFVTKANVARFTRTFGTLMTSGVNILEALKITRDIIPNAVVAESLDRVHDRVRDGEPLATPLEQQKVFPTMVASMVQVGEETGELAEMLNRIADTYEEDLDNAVAGITSIIEPIMIIFLAVVVGVIVVALFLPIIGMIQHMGGG